ncbi:unnamed protein product [Arabidopsis arenosa]|uniref:Gnk2-homologous domain-containing protein n=1 Tax=Arabidopsis arenosa TaxID=38785 RepID=A0A8S2AVK3_ARAAE|nr:unnamed protein product [Arabidopsis arenosa]
MSSLTTFIFLFLFSFLTTFTASAQEPNDLAYWCPNRTTYSSNSTYFTNLKTLLSSLSSPNASYSTGFQNATVGQAPDRVTGLFLSRGDLSPEVCRSCVTFAVNNTFNRCPNQREAVFYYDECMLRYSHKNILSTTNTNEGEYIMRNPNNISPIQNQTNQFIILVLSNMNQAATEAANNSRKFSTIKTELTALQTLYGLVQCTPDLSRESCMSCLTSSINRMSFYRIGARQLSPSCNSRYELYSFYNETAIGTPPPPPPLPPPPMQFPGSSPPLASPSLPGKSGNSNVLVVAIVVPIILAVLLLIAGYCFFAKRAKKTYGTTPALDESCRKSEVVRCIHIGLLCVQESPVERPALSTISVMLTSNTMTLPTPQQPGFFGRSIPGTNPLDSDQSMNSKSVPVSIDDSSMSDLYPR